jgi:H/ACA ribonucleoprotein complex subunit 4
MTKEKFPQELLNFSIINIDKPTGPTSLEVSNFIKNSLKLTKTSHLGTLDPQVTGVLPIALGRACKLNEWLMNKNKTYVGIMRTHEDVSSEKLKEILSSFIGKINQLPPVRSSVKREIREREIIYFKILEINGKDILFETEVQAGTYIRKLIHDIGEKIGGAHMLELRRIKAGIFTEEKSLTLYEFEKILAEDRIKEVLIPAEEIIKKILPVVQLNKLSLKKILTGKPLSSEDITSKLPNEKQFSLFLENQFVGIYLKSNERNIIARPQFVFN